jgi:glycine betaine/proline transport system substrate-binding protein
VKCVDLTPNPHGDINGQNTKIREGEKSQKDIERHVKEWIVKTLGKWKGWLAAHAKQPISICETILKAGD